MSIEAGNQKVLKEKPFSPAIPFVSYNCPWNLFFIFLNTGILKGIECIFLLDWMILKNEKVNREWWECLKG